MEVFEFVHLMSSKILLLHNAAISIRELDISETVALRHMLKTQAFAQQYFWPYA